MFRFPAIILIPADLFQKLPTGNKLPKPGCSKGHELPLLAMGYDVEIEGRMKRFMNVCKNKSGKLFYYDDFDDRWKPVEDSGHLVTYQPS
jgi:hypothetical protein